MAYKVVGGKLVKIKKNRNRDRQMFNAGVAQERKTNEIVKRQLERFDIDKLGTMDRHNAMYDLAERNERKGKKGGDCNVTQCQKPGASCYNPPMRAYYCYKCASDIRNSSLRHGDEPFILPEHLHRDFTFKYKD